MPRASATAPAAEPVSLGLARPSEDLVAWVWQAGAVRDPWLTLEDGSRRRVVFPGRRWGWAGPDFRGAVLERSDGTLERGDVEVHVLARDWRVHGHQRDPEYARVVLHVVLQADGHAALLSDGRAVPTVALAGQLAAPLALLRTRFEAERDARPPIAACVSDPAAAAALLESAGLQRFVDRAAAYEGDLACFSAEQALYRGLLVAMGYSANKDPCARLAERLPYAELAAALGARPPERRVAAARALLLGRAGLLPSVEQPVPGDVLREWALLDPRDDAGLRRGAWRFRATRPDNSPLRRLAGLAAWLAARHGRDWVGELLHAVCEAVEKPARLAELFRVRAEDQYWPWHWDFGRRLHAARPWLIGSGRAQEMVVNVLLPAAHALGQARGDEALSATALRAYRALPSTPGNRIVREMAEQVAGGAARGLRLTACQQQGLIHLYKEWCADRACERCPAGQKPLPLFEAEDE